MSELSAETVIDPEIDEAPPLKPDVQEALNLMNEVCQACSDDLHAEIVSKKGDYLTIDLVGGEGAEMWGRAGRSLDALQFLCNLILARPGFTPIFASPSTPTTIANAAPASSPKRRVKSRPWSRPERGDAVMDSLPAHERRIVHSALVDDPEIETFSEGEEPNRRIVICQRRAAAN